MSTGTMIFKGKPFSLSYPGHRSIDFPVILYDQPVQPYAGLQNSVIVTVCVYQAVQFALKHSDIVLQHALHLFICKINGCNFSLLNFLIRFCLICFIFFFIVCSFRLFLRGRVLFCCFRSLIRRFRGVNRLIFGFIFIELL